MASRTVGCDAITHPIITFSVNLERPTDELVGPKTNQKSVNLLHPDMHDSSPDRGRTNAAQHDVQRISWLPGFLAAENLTLEDDDTIVAYGQKATYLKKTYTTGTNPRLTVVTETYASA